MRFNSRHIEDIPLATIETIARIREHVDQYSDAGEAELEVIVTHLGIAYLMGYNVAGDILENITLDRSTEIVTAFSIFYQEFLTRAVDARVQAGMPEYAVYYTACTTFLMLSGFYDYVRELYPDLRSPAENFLNDLDGLDADKQED